MTRLRALRLERGLTQLQLASLAGCSETAIYYLEHGQRRPRLSLARRIATVLGVPIEDVFPEEEEEHDAQGQSDAAAETRGLTRDPDTDADRGVSAAES